MLIKLRFRFPEVILGMLLAVALFALGATFWSSQQTPAQPNSGAKTDDAANQQKQKEGWLERAADPLNVVTLLLVIVGAAQLGLFWRQLTLIRESLDDAKKAADAAKESADAAKISADHIPRVERAYVYATPVPLIDGDRTIISLKVVNAGQTPGFLSAGYGSASDTEPTGLPIYPPMDKNPRIIDAVIRKDATELFPTHWWSPTIQPHYFYGYIKYTDIFRSEHTTRFCVKVYPAEGKLDLAGTPPWNAWD